MSDSLARFVDSLSYKPGWRFKLAGPLNQYLCVYSLTADSTAPTVDRVTQHQFKFPDPLPDHRALCRWVRDRLLDVERHETCEFLVIGGTRPFYPNHQDEGSPYADVEHWPERAEMEVA